MEYEREKARLSSQHSNIVQQLETLKDTIIKIEKDKNRLDK